MIDQCSELCRLVAQNRKFSLNRMKAIARAREFRTVSYALVFAQRAEDPRVISVQRVSRDVRQLAQRTDGDAPGNTRARRRQGSQSLLKPISG